MCPFLISSSSQHQALVFIRENDGQIRQKAAKFCVDVDDVRQTVCLIFLESGHLFDESRGSLAAFVFGRLEKILARQAGGPLRFALSLDDDTQLGEALRAIVEAKALAVGGNDDVCTDSGDEAAPGAASLVAIADVISGKSALEFARKRGLTKRRINQILKRVRDDARTQFALDFAGEV